MSPSSAILFILFGIALTLMILYPGQKGARIYVWISVFTGTAVALLLFSLSIQEIHLNTEHLGFTVIETVGMSPVGHMSPVTAVCFILTGLAFFFLLFPFQRKTNGIVVSLILSLLLLILGLVFLLRYITGNPFLYNVSTSPPAITTLISFLLLSIGLLAWSALNLGSENNFQNLFFRKTTFVLVGILLISSAIIILIGIFYFQNYESKYQKEVGKNLEAVARLKSAELQLFLDKSLDYAIHLYKNPVFSDLLKDYIYHPDHAFTEQKLLTWIREYSDLADYEHVYILDVTGNLLFSDPASDHLISDQIHQMLPEIHSSTEPIYHDFYLDEYSGKISLTILVPVIDNVDTTKILGIVGLEINPYHYLFPFISMWPTSSESAETLIVRRDSNDVVFLNPLRFSDIQPLQLRRSMTDQLLPAAAAAAGAIGLITGHDYRGQPVLAYVMPVSDSPWFLVARIDLEEVYEPIRKHFWTMISLITLLLVIMASSIILIYRNRRIRFLKDKVIVQEKLLESEEKFSKVFHKSPISMSISRIEDGVFIDVNKMFTEVCGYSRKEVIGKTSIQLKFFTKKTWQQLTENIRDNEVIKNMEVDFILKGRRHIKCLFNAQIVEINQEPNLFSTFMDITEQKRTAELLLKEMARLELTNEHMVDRELRMVELKREIARLEEEVKGKR